MSKIAQGHNFTLLVLLLVPNSKELFVYGFKVGYVFDKLQILNVVLEGIDFHTPIAGWKLFHIFKSYNVFFKKTNFLRSGYFLISYLLYSSETDMRNLTYSILFS